MFVGNCGKFVQNHAKKTSNQPTFEHCNNLIFKILRLFSREVGKVVDKWKKRNRMVIIERSFVRKHPIATMGITRDSLHDSETAHN